MIDPATQKLGPQIPRGTKVVKKVKVVKGVVCERGGGKTGLPAHRGEEFFWIYAHGGSLWRKSVWQAKAKWWECVWQAKAKPRPKAQRQKAK